MHPAKKVMRERDRKEPSSLLEIKEELRNALMTVANNANILRGEIIAKYTDIMSEAIAIFFTRQKTDGDLKKHFLYEEKSVMQMIHLKYTRLVANLKTPGTISDIREHLVDLINYSAFMEACYGRPNESSAISDDS